MATSRRGNTFPQDMRPSLREQNKHDRHFGFIVGSIAIVCIIVLIIFVFLSPTHTLSINGQTQKVAFGATFQDAIDQGYATPTPGNLVAVDGSVLEAGAGEPFVATYGDKQTNDPRARLPFKTDISIEDGNDIIEEYDEATEPIPFDTEENLPASTSGYSNQAIHLYSDGIDGQRIARTGKISGTTVYEITTPAIPAGYSAYNPDVGDDRVIALTFDDGPLDGSTQEIADILSQYNAHATFFEIGTQVQRHPEITKALHDAGHQIASHTWDHAAGSGEGVNLTYMSAEEQVWEITKSFDAIDAAVGMPVSRVLRTPGGNYYGSLIPTIHPYIDCEIGWNVDTRDWSRPGVASIVDTLKNVRPGQIVLMHDGGGDRSQTSEALREALPYLVDQGYTFVTIDELLTYPAASA